MTTQAPILYGADGAPLAATKAAPDFDPKFLLSFAETMGGQSGSLLRRAQEAPYQYYVWVYACASAISMNLSRLAPALFDKDDSNKVTREHPVLKVLRRPNPYMTGSQFLEAIVLNLMLPSRRTPGGQCFLVPDFAVGERPTDFSRGQVPRALYPFSDNYVFPKIRDGQLVAWELRIPEKAPLLLDPDEVVRIHLYNPYSLLLGMSPYAAAVYAIEGDTKAQELSRQFSDNAANVGGMLTTDKGMNPQQAEEMRREWESKYGGSAKAGRTAILHSGLKYEQTAKSLSDLQWIDGRRLNREEVLASYRVPPFVLGQDSANYATSVQAWRTFWTETLIPLLEKIWEPVNSQWVENIDGGRHRIFSDTSTVTALRRDYKEAIGIADIMITKHGVPASAAYRTLDIPLDAKAFPWLDLPLVIGSRVNLADGSVVGQPTFPDFGGAGDDKEPKETGDGSESNPPKGDGDDKSLRTLERIQSIQTRASSRDRFWLAWVKRTLTPGETRMRTALTRYLVHQRNAVLDLVDDWADKSDTKAAAVIRALSVNDFLLSLQEENARLRAMVDPIYDVGIEAQAAQMEDELGDLVNWNQSSPYVERYKKARLKYIQQINTYTFQLAKDEIGKAVDEATSNNLTTQETANLIKDRVQTVYGHRLNNAPTIARTEMGSIATTTRVSIMEKEGIEKQEWLSARDERTRAEHLEEDGHQVVVGEAFPVTGLLHPCQIGGAPGQVINCRCTVVPVMEG